MKHNTNNNKKFPNLRFKEFEGEWEKITLHSIALITKGTGISKDQLSLNGMPCILYGELYTKYKYEIINEIISRTDINPTNLVKSKVNDVIIPSSGETAIDISTARCVTQNDILLGGDLNIIRLKNDDGCFLSYQLNGIRKLDIAKIAQGVSVVHLYGEKLKHLQVYMPEKIEQKKISSLLYQIDERISTQIKIIEKFESLIKGLCRLLIMNNKPTTKIKDCLVCHSSTLSESEIVNDSGIFCVYGATGIIAYTSQYQIDQDSILIIKDGSGVGRVQYANGKYSTIGTLNSLTAKNNVCLKYLFYFLSIFNFEKFIVGSGIPHIYFKDYGEAVFYCPSYDEQQKTANVLTTITDKVEIEKQMLQKMKEQKQYLLSNLFI
ncbi:restriction endonuclease subunit S [Bacteroides sp. CG01]|uniref:restriction endonuclease subunit S n=1 Tax=Bacteroides sp. CG01 TaxID=3096000 RepID=UPI002B0015AE|nr:restriction endonuclease subunit S [Bacteroides sp. CG01]